MDFKESVTWKEIVQQPSIWKEEMEILKGVIDEIQLYVKQYSEDSVRIIFTGAGSSEFVGNTIANYIDKKVDMEVISVPTTDIVSMPEMYLDSKKATILISCARSGNSPESVATVEIADSYVKKIAHIFVTCNATGKLAQMSSQAKNRKLILMPERSNDKGFAMTGSFSSMVIAGICILLQNQFKHLSVDFEKVAQFMEINMDMLLSYAQKIANLNMERIVYLGDGVCKGLAEETSLKILELTGGEIASFYNTFLGFRHGPKSIINDKTVIVCMMSNQPYTRKYELDLLKEFKHEGGKKKTVVLDSYYDDEVAKNADYYFTIGQEELKSKDDIFTALFYLVIGQMVSLVKSALLGKNPDNPCPTGEVNRVVKGVIIHKYSK